MAGHSQFKNIMHRKGRQDAARSRLFSKLSREITVAARCGGQDPDTNSRLRLAIQNARTQSMPKDNIARAISRSQAGDDAVYEEVRYEGYGPGGVAVIVETLTDNRNRTASSVRSVFSKMGGNLGEAGSVAFAFEHVGEIRFPLAAGDSDELLMAAADAGARDIESDDDGHIVICAFEDLAKVAGALEAALGSPQDVRPVWRPLSTAPVDDVANAAQLFKLLMALEDDDDVQNVFDNAAIPHEIAREAAA